MTRRYLPQTLLDPLRRPVPLTPKYTMIPGGFDPNRPISPSQSPLYTGDPIRPPPWQTPSRRPYPLPPTPPTSPPLTPSPIGPRLAPRRAPPPRSSGGVLPMIAPPSFSYAQPASSGIATQIANDKNAAAIQNYYAAKAAMDQLRMSVPRYGKGTRLSQVASAYGGAGGFGGGGGGGSLPSAYQAAYDEARAANEARYAEAKAMAQERYNRNLGTLSGMGGQESQDINRVYDEALAAEQQRLVGRGLGTSSLTGDVSTANLRERTDAQGRLQERLRREQVATDADLSGDILGIIERRQDPYPDLGQYIALAQMQGQSGGGLSGVPIYASGFQVPLSAYGIRPSMGGGRVSSTATGGYDRAAARETHRLERLAEEDYRRRLADWARAGGRRV